MRGWLLDTNVVAELMRPQPDPAVLAWAAAQHRRHLHISALTLGEYEQGISNLPEGDPRRLRYEAGLASVRSSFDGRILPVSEAVARHWGRMAGSARRRVGRRPPVVDALLAATAVAEDLHLATRNGRDVEGLGASVFDPWQDDPARFPVL